MKEENNSWKAVLKAALFIIMVGSAIFIIQSTSRPETKDKEDNTKTEEKENTKEETKKEETEYKEQEEFTNQNGEEVKISGDKVVSATGFAGASNYKFYLRNGTLYFRNISKDEEEIIATGVKDLYLENKEVTAELSEEGKVVKENNYITYK